MSNTNTSSNTSSRKPTPNSNASAGSPAAPNFKSNPSSAFSPYNNDKRFSVLSNNSASVRQKSFDSPRYNTLNNANNRYSVLNGSGSHLSHSQINLLLHSQLPQVINTDSGNFNNGTVNNNPPNTINPTSNINTSMANNNYITSGHRIINDGESSNASLYTALEVHSTDALITGHHSSSANNNNSNTNNALLRRPSSRPRGLHLLSRRTSVLQKNPKSHKHHVKSMPIHSAASPYLGAPGANGTPGPRVPVHPLFRKQKKYKFMMFRRRASKRFKRNLNPAFANKQQLYNRLDTVMRSGSIHYDIMPPTMLKFGYSGAQDSLHRYYGLQPVSRSGTIKAKKLPNGSSFGLQRQVTTKKKPKFVFNRFRKSSRKTKDDSSLNREQRKELIKSQILKLSNEEILLNSRFKTFIDLENQKRPSDEATNEYQLKHHHGRSHSELQEIVDDNSSTYSVQLITNSKVTGSPSPTKDKKKKSKSKNNKGKSKRTIHDKNIFFQLLQLNPELRSQLQCADLGQRDELILRAPSMEYETLSANGLNYGFNRKSFGRMSQYGNKRNTNRMSVRQAMDGAAAMAATADGESKENSDEFNRIISDDNTNRNDIVKPQEAGSEPQQPLWTSQNDAINESIVNRKEIDSTMRIVPQLVASNSTIPQRSQDQPRGHVLAHNEHLDSPITYNFFSKDNSNRGLRLQTVGALSKGEKFPREEIVSATSSNFPQHRGFVRQSVVSLSTNNDNDNGGNQNNHIVNERFYTPPTTTGLLTKGSNDSGIVINDNSNYKTGAAIGGAVGAIGTSVAGGAIASRRSSDNKSDNTNNSEDRHRNNALNSLQASQEVPELEARKQIESDFPMPPMPPMPPIIYKDWGSDNGSHSGKPTPVSLADSTYNKKNNSQDETLSSQRSSTADFQDFEKQLVSEGTDANNHNQKITPEIDIVPVGIASQFDISASKSGNKNKKRNSTVATQGQDLNEQLANVSKIERRSLLEHANSMKKRKHKLIFGALFGGGKVGLKPGNSRSNKKNRRSFVGGGDSSLSSEKAVGTGIGATATAAATAAAAATHAGVNDLAIAGLGISNSASSLSLAQNKDNHEVKHGFGPFSDVVNANKGSTADVQLLALPKFDTFMSDKEKLIKEIDTNSLINLTTKKSAFQSHVVDRNQFGTSSRSPSTFKESDEANTSGERTIGKSDIAKSELSDAKNQEQKVQLRVTNISADEYKRYTDIYEQNKDKVINPDYIISDSDEAELQRELNSFNPQMIQKMIQRKVAKDNGMRTPLDRLSPQNSASSRDQFYARRSIIDNGKDKASTSSSNSSIQVGDDGNISNNTPNPGPPLLLPPMLPLPRILPDDIVAAGLASTTASNPRQQVAKSASQMPISIPVPTPVSAIPVANVAEHPSSESGYASKSSLSNSNNNSGIILRGSSNGSSYNHINSNSNNPHGRPYSPASMSTGTGTTASYSHSNTNSEAYSSSGSNSNNYYHYTSSSNSRSASNGSSSGQSSGNNNGNAPSGQSYEVWGRYMKRIVNQRINYRLQNSLLAGISAGQLGSTGGTNDNELIPISETPEESGYSNSSNRHAVDMPFAGQRGFSGSGNSGTNANAFSHESFNSPARTLSSGSKHTFVTAYSDSDHIESAEVPAAVSTPIGSSHSKLAIGSGFRKNSGSPATPASYSNYHNNHQYSSGNNFRNASFSSASSSNENYGHRFASVSRESSKGNSNTNGQHGQYGSRFQLIAKKLSNSSSSSSATSKPTPKFGDFQSQSQFQLPYYRQDEQLSSNPANNNLTSISETGHHNRGSLLSNRNLTQSPQSQIESDRSHSSMSNRSNGSVSIRSVIGNKEIKVSYNGSGNVAGGGELPHSSVSLSFKNVGSPKGSVVSTGSRGSFRSAKSSSSSLLIKPS